MQASRRVIFGVADPGGASGAPPLAVSLPGGLCGCMLLLGKLPVVFDHSATYWVRGRLGPGLAYAAGKVSCTTASLAPSWRSPGSFVIRAANRGKRIVPV